MSKLRRSLLVGLFAVILSTVGIQASDVFRGVEGNLTGLVMDSSGPCGDGAKQLLLGSRAICVDTFEAAPNDSCSHKDPKSPQQTQDNLNETECKTVSDSGLIPWRFVTFTQAQQICARSGKRLPTNEEWYKAVSGITDIESCAIDTKGSSPQATGLAECVSPLGVHDLVGNVWEWVDEEVVDGIYNERTLPETGYVSSVDRDGVVVETSSSEQEEFGDDYAWTSDSGVRAVLRGGFYGSGTDAGVFSQNMSVALNLSVAGVGFRCVKDI